MTPSGTVCSSVWKDLVDCCRPLPDGYWPVPPMGRGVRFYPKNPRAWWPQIAEGMLPGCQNQSRPRSTESVALWTIYLIFHKFRQD